MEFKVIKLDRKRNNVVLSRRAVVEASDGRRARQADGNLKEGAIVRAWSRTSPNTVPSWTWAASTACCTSPTWHGAACVTLRGGHRWPGNHRQDPQVRHRKNPCLPGSQANGRRPWMGVRRYPRAPACSARSRTLPTTARSSNSNPALKAWCTCPKWTGRTRTSLLPSWSRWATKSKSWSWRSTKTSAASAWA